VKLRTWSGSIIETKDYTIAVWWRWAMGWIRHIISKMGKEQD
jgi:hypothetical protein